MDAEATDDQLAELDRRCNDAVQVAKRAMARVSELESELEERDQRIYELQQAVETLQDGDRLMQEVHQNAASVATKRAIKIIRTLNNEAITNGQSGRKKSSTINIKEAKKVVGGKVDRTTFYDTFDLAQDLVDNSDVLEYKTPPRSSKKNHRLVLDLDAGDLPASIEGFPIRTPEYATGNGGAQ